MNNEPTELYEINREWAEAYKDLESVNKALRLEITGLKQIHAAKMTEQWSLCNGGPYTRLCLKDEAKRDELEIAAVEIVARGMFHA